jgi:hypothetical protein
MGDQGGSVVGFSYPAAASFVEGRTVPAANQGCCDAEHSERG